MRNVKIISRERFNAYVDWTRNPYIDDYITEIEWYADTRERVLGVLVFDHTDEDFNYILLGRDRDGRFRGIDLNHSLPSIGMARGRLKKALQQKSETGQTIFPQGDETGQSVDLFTPITPNERWHPSFKAMLEYPHWQPAVSMMSEMMRHFVDVDGNLVEQFQTAGFDARLWELYLYAYLKEEKLFIDRDCHAPDYMVGKGGKKIAIEAVTVNASNNAKPIEHDGGKPLLRSQEEINELLKDVMPLKFGSALFSKLSKDPKYWELEHVVGHPLVFAVADFHEPQSMTWSFPAILQYLYGVRHGFAYNEKGELVISALKIDFHTKENGNKVPSGFFFQPDAENVSAVLFSSSGTLSKFNRMGRLAGFGDSKSIMMRIGVCHNHDPNASLPIPFDFIIKPGGVTESWAEGLSMYHNPTANHPVPKELFPSIAHHEYRNGQIYSQMPEFHPYSSMTIHLRQK